MIEVEELYDYDVLRRVEEPTMFVVRLAKPTLVLGSSQSADLLQLENPAEYEIRRRRGGGGIVLLQPDDVWVDWWIPSTDARWVSDVQVASIAAGNWWKLALEEHLLGSLVVHEGALEGEQEHRVVCFAGKGPGEVFIDDKKAVGVTQWRVREGTFLSTVIHSQDSSGVLNVLKRQPKGLLGAIAHHTLDSIGVKDPEELLRDLAEISGPWLVRQLYLSA